MMLWHCNQLLSLYLSRHLVFWINPFPLVLSKTSMKWRIIEKNAGSCRERLSLSFSPLQFITSQRMCNTYRIFSDGVGYNTKWNIRGFSKKGSKFLISYMNAMLFLGKYSGPTNVEWRKKWNKSCRVFLIDSTYNLQSTPFSPICLHLLYTEVDL